MFIQLLISGISTGSIYALVALSMAILVSAVNVVNFAAGDFVMLGAFLIVTTAAIWHFPYPLAVIAAIVLMGALGYVFYRLAYYPLRRRGFLPVIISTVGCSLAFQNVAQIIWGKLPLSADPPLGSICSRSATYSFSRSISLSWSLRLSPLWFNMCSSSAFLSAAA